MKLKTSGKVKDIYEYDEDTLLFHFSDRISAFDIVFNEPIPRKGEILCKFGKFWFDSLDFPNHMIKIIEPDKMLVKKLEIIPLEFVVRGYYYGSLVDRVEKGLFHLHDGKNNNKSRNFILAEKLDKPLFDPTTKSIDHDIPITKEEIIEKKILTSVEYNKLEDISISLYKQMYDIASSVNFILADVKFEFGYDKKTGNLLLADSIGPDEHRLWSKDRYTIGKIQESYDKQQFRDWLIDVGFKKQVDDLSLENKKPEPIKIPDNIVNRISETYVYIFEKISRKKLNHV